ncbi:TIGR03086 family metal-binding protein [Actinomycetospora termitidis]|uniref:TIGR03086 family metal-binding protein n=1 Tax=Actinomycetospora termitidis TaxID=3053470 RepID=A0ABT7M1X9_9PSEU|nr:TIGR03086 family metal-binding protein [Actinomycetospora sp. Odt1-22]MDL5154660.1 TIGR03086 family metal-binding protein [Actinomycetospora sp. Odt1-22]
MDAAQEYREIAGRFTQVVEGVPDEETWNRQSPVPAWTARDVVRHLVEWFPGFLEGGAGVRLPAGPSVDQDPVAAWRTMSDGVQALLEDPTTAEKQLVNPHIGTVPLPQAVLQFFGADVFMHTWDLARATGQDERLDPARCAALLEGMEPMDEILRASGQYGPRVEVDPDADVQTRMLAFIGRDPR